MKVKHKVAKTSSSQRGFKKEDAKQIDIVLHRAGEDYKLRFYCLAGAEEIDFEKTKSYYGPLDHPVVLNVFVKETIYIPKWLDPKDFVKCPEKWTYLWNKTRFSELDEGFQQYLIQFGQRRAHVLSEYLARKAKSSNTEEVQQLVKLAYLSQSPYFPLTEKFYKQLENWVPALSDDLSGKFGILFG
jgi:hypothetical protein